MTTRWNKHPAALTDLSRVADGVYSYVGVKDAFLANSFATNAGIVIGRDSLLVVDTLISAKEALCFLVDIRNVSEPIKHVANTHTLLVIAIHHTHLQTLQNSYQTAIRKLLLFRVLAIRQRDFASMIAT